MNNACLLVQLYGDLQPPNVEPFSVAVLAGQLELDHPHLDVDLFVINPAVNQNCFNEFIELVEGEKYDLIGLSIPQGTYHIATDALDQLHSTFNDRSPANRPTVVLGHAVPTHAPDLLLSEYPWTICVRGWGEVGLTQLVDNLKNDRPLTEGVSNIAYVDAEGKIVCTPVQDDVQPAPPVRYQPTQFFPRVETSRGCHYGKCTFCTRPLGRPDYWERVPLATIEQSILSLKSNGVDYFTFTDEDFIGNDLDGALKIAQLLQDIGGMKFSFSVRADNIYNPQATPQENQLRKTTLKTLKEAGLEYLFVGIESLSNSQLRRYAKKSTVVDITRAVQIINSYDIPLEVGFMLFDPFVTITELEEITVNLQNSGIWQNVGAHFMAMAVQKDTSFERWMQSKSLLSELDTNTLSYGWEFVEPGMNHIAQLCLGWYSGPYRMVYKLLRNLTRTKRLPIAIEFMRSLRRLDLSVLEYVIYEVKYSQGTINDIDIALDFYQQRTRFLTYLHRYFAGRDLPPEERLLFSALQEFFLAN